MNICAIVCQMILALHMLMLFCIDLVPISSGLLKCVTKRVTGFLRMIKVAIFSLYYHTSGFFVKYEKCETLSLHDFRWAKMLMGIFFWGSCTLVDLYGLV